ncbi:hypothetical protein A9G12_09475 [Gilliamella sp. wkB112]|nr:hypothetical protein A9G12_09475 [Gilliamella apicola]
MRNVTITLPKNYKFVSKPSIGWVFFSKKQVIQPIDLNIIDNSKNIPNIINNNCNLLNDYCM